MSNILSDQEIDILIKLGKDISEDLTCDANGTGFPCRTCRLNAVYNMVSYLHIHDIVIQEEDELRMAEGEVES